MIWAVLAKKRAKKLAKALVADEHDIVAKGQLGGVLTYDLVHEQKTVGYGARNRLGEVRKEKQAFYS
jgi:hypothetical protein